MADDVKVRRKSDGLEFKLAASVYKAFVASGDVEVVKEAGDNDEEPTRRRSSSRSKGGRKPRGKKSQDSSDKAASDESSEDAASSEDSSGESSDG